MIKPYGLLSDSHFHNWNQFSHLDENGVNNRLKHILVEFERCARAVVDAGGDTIYHGGDLFHVRGSIPPSVMNPVVATITGSIERHGVNFVFMPGNHDMEFNDSQQVGYSMGALDNIDGVTVVTEATAFPDHQVYIVPWKDDLGALREECKGLDAPHYDLIIHAPLNGVIKGIPDHGLEASEVAAWGFKRVFVGHYHRHAIFEGGVMSIGATTHQTFSDIDTLAGFVIVSEDSAEFHKSVAPKFIDYDLGWGAAEAEANCKGNYVRIRLGECTEEEIRLMRDGITEFGAAGVVIQATPSKEIVAREHTLVEGGESLAESVTSYVEADDAIKNKDEVLKECFSVLDEVQEVA